MAVLSIDLLANSTHTYDSGNSADGDTVQITALGDSLLIVDGVSLTITSIAGINLGAAPTFRTINGGDLTIDNGLLDASALSSFTFEVFDNSAMTLDASTLSLAVLNGLLDTYDVAYSGPYGTGTFTYDPPVLSVLGIQPVNFETTGMQATDQFIVSGRTIELDESTPGDPSSAYDGSVLHLTVDGGLLTQSVNIDVPMTADEASDFFSNQATLLDGDTFTFPGVALACLTTGTPVATLAGDVAVENLRVGHRVLTMDNGYQPIRWVGCRHLAEEDLERNPELRPIRIRANALGKGRPERDIVVSPQHRVLVSNAIAERMFGQKEVLVAAKHLLSLDGINIAEEITSVTYWHFFFDQHQIVFSNGAATESLYLGSESIKALPAEARREILTLFPDIEQYLSARPLVSGRRARKLSERISKNRKMLVDH
ncbi:Hint domain-containing protein [Salipiger bermudensis]|uniref:Hint domain-containing protein n=1 Tax=Salipiger bermudensis TaxID=344736 RepID=UPI0021BD8B98|nr:Hint domain-containing protein [Salipiger bermudensis]